MLVYETRYLWSTISEQTTFHPPLFIIALKPFALVSENEWVVRAFPAVMGALTCVTTTVLGFELLTPGAAWLGGLFLAVNPFAIYFSQQLRPYSLFSFGAALFLLYGARLLVHSQWTRTTIAKYLMAALVMVYTHFFAALLIVTLNVFYGMFLSKLKPNLKTWTLMQAITAGFYLPMISFAFLITNSVVSAPDIWIQQVTPRTFYDSFKFYNLGFYMVGPQVKLLLVGLAAVLLYSVFLPRYPLRTRTFLTSALVLPLGLMAGISMCLQPIYLERSCIFVMIPLALLIGAGLDALPYRLGMGALAILVVCYAPALVRQYRNEPFPYPNRTACPRMEVNLAAKYIKEVGGASDLACHTHLHGLMPFLYYLRSTPQAYVLLNLEQKQEVLGGFTFPIEGVEKTVRRYGAEFAAIADVLSEHQRVWLVFTRAGVNNELDSQARAVLAAFTEKKWHQIDYKRFMGIELYRYSAPGPPDSSASWDRE